MRTCIRKIGLTEISLKKHKKCQTYVFQSDAPPCHGDPDMERQTIAEAELSEEDVVDGPAGSADSGGSGGWQWGMTMISALGTVSAISYRVYKSWLARKQDRRDREYHAARMGEMRSRV